ncbi:MAG: PEP-CTERM sorting domain-containing protein [Phycisphaerales bacterium]
MARLSICVAAVALISGGVAFAHWDVGDLYKMHYPQLPDETGWDVYAEWPKGIADDWLCTESGYVEDIHFWGSWKDDIVGYTGQVYIGIYDNDTSGFFAKPGDVLWEHTFTQNDYTSRLYGTGEQGWYHPEIGYILNDHENIYQYNIDLIPDPFYQEEGNTYWLMISMDYYDCYWGWKTSKSEQFGADAVYYGWVDYQWCAYELYDPITYESLDMAFVITPEPTSLLLLAMGATVVLKRQRK